MLSFLLFFEACPQKLLNLPIVEEVLRKFPWNSKIKIPTSIPKAVSPRESPGAGRQFPHHSPGRSICLRNLDSESVDGLEVSLELAVCAIDRMLRILYGQLTWGCSELNMIKAL